MSHKNDIPGSEVPPVSEWPPPLEYDPEAFEDVDQSADASGWGRAVALLSIGAVIGFALERIL